MDEEPPTIDLHINFACAPRPMEFRLVLLVHPKRIHIDYRKSPVELLRHLDPNGVAAIMDKSELVE